MSPSHHPPRILSGVFQFLLLSISLLISYAQTQMPNFSRHAKFCTSVLPLAILRCLTTNNAVSEMIL